MVILKIGTSPNWLNVLICIKIPLKSPIWYFLKLIFLLLLCWFFTSRSSSLQITHAGVKCSEDEISCCASLDPVCCKFYFLLPIWITVTTYSPGSVGGRVHEVGDPVAKIWMCVLPTGNCLAVPLLCLWLTIWWISERQKVLLMINVVCFRLYHWIQFKSSAMGQRKRKLKMREWWIKIFLPYVFVWNCCIIILFADV